MFLAVLAVAFLGARKTRDCALVSLYGFTLYCMFCSLTASSGRSRPLLGAVFEKIALAGFPLKATVGISIWLFSPRSSNLNVAFAEPSWLFGTFFCWLIIQSAEPIVQNKLTKRSTTKTASFMLLPENARFILLIALLAFTALPVEFSAALSVAVCALKL